VFHVKSLEQLSIKEGSLFVFFICNVEISQVTAPLIVLLVSSLHQEITESTQVAISI